MLIPLSYRGPKGYQTCHADVYEGQYTIAREVKVALHPTESLALLCVDRQLIECPLHLGDMRFYVQLSESRPYQTPQA